MTEAFAALPEGFLWLLGGVLLAGLVRGFTGFGTAMVYTPVAAQVLPPFEALTTLIIIDLVGPLPNVPRALRDGHPRDVLRLGVGLVLFLPLGAWVLLTVPPEVFRYTVSLVALVLLGCLIAGLRYRGPLTPQVIFGTGALSGFLGGAAGLAGPPVILLYMASDSAVAVIRANTLLFLLLSDVVLLIVFVLIGQLVPAAVWIGILLIPPYLLANVAGAAIFRPQHERVYRWVAYLIIAASALTGLPAFDRDTTMQMSEVSYTGGQPVDGYGPGFFRIGGEVHEGAVVLLPDGAQNWAGPEDLEPFAAADIDVLFFGTGAEIAHAPPAFRAALEAQGIGVEVMNSPAACRTYNVLLSEGRRIGAALLPVVAD